MAVSVIRTITRPSVDIDFEPSHLEDILNALDEDYMKKNLSELVILKNFMLSDDELTQTKESVYLDEKSFALILFHDINDTGWLNYKLELYNYYKNNNISYTININWNYQI